MALQKAITDEKGYTAEYHKIISYSYDAWSDRTSILVSIFKDQVARDDLKMPVDSKNYYFDGHEPENREDCYTLLKTLDDYSGAQDC